MKKFLKLALVSASLLAMAAPASAAVIYQFDLTGAATASFQLSSEPDPTGTRSDFGYDAFYIQGVPVTLNGNAGTAELEFAGPNDWYGGFGINVGGGAYEVSTFGAYLFSGPSSNPVFNTGTYNLAGYFNSNLKYQLTISELSAAVPEPATWAMMIGGFGLVGAGLRRRRASISVSYA